MISTVTYTGDGATRVFPVAFEIQGENYVVVFIDDVAVNDRTTYDIINNSIVFVENNAPAVSSLIEIVIASSPTEIADLNAPPSSVQTVLDNLVGITSVAANIDNVNAVNTNKTNIDAVVANSTNINTVSTNIDDVNELATWISNPVSVLPAKADRKTYTATQGQTTFNALYTVGQADVWLNGSKLQGGVDFTATDGLTIVLTTPATAGDIVDITALGAFAIADVISKSDIAYTVATVEDLVNVPNSYTTAIVKDLNRGGTFVWSDTGTANGGTVFAGATGFWKRQYSGAVNVKWFGAKGDGSTDDTLAIQNAVDSCKNIYIPNGGYLITAPIVLTESYTVIIGDKELPYIYMDSSLGQAFKITSAGGTSINEFSKIENLAIWSTTKPTYSYPSETNCAISVHSSGSTIATPISRLQLKNIRIIGYGTGIYLKQHVNTLLDRIFIENHTDYSSDTTTTGSYVGIYFDSTPFTVGGISPNASVRITDCLVNVGLAPTLVQAIGFKAYGSDIRDLLFDNCETVNGNMGWWIEGTDSNYNCDIIIKRPIIDQFTQAGIYMLNVKGGSSAIITGGYIAGSSSSTLGAIYLDGTDGVSISNNQILGFNNSTINDCGIFLLSSSNCTITNNICENLTYGITLFASSNNIISNNVVFASETDLEDTYYLLIAIRLISLSIKNSIVGNSISGISASVLYETGIYIESGSLYNTISTNSIDTISVTSSYNIAERNNAINTVLGSTQTIQAPQNRLISNTSTQLYMGNDASYPHQFQDGGGNNIAGMNNAGVLVANSDRRLKDNIEELKYGLSDILKLNPKTFNLKNELKISDNAPTRLGLIAQDVQKVVPELVDDSQEFLKLDYISLVPILIRAIQELDKKVDRMQQ